MEEGDEASAAAAAALTQLKGAAVAIHACMRMANFRDKDRRPSRLEMDLVDLDLSADALGATFVPTPTPGHLTPKAGAFTPKAAKIKSPKRSNSRGKQSILSQGEGTRRPPRFGGNGI